MNLRNICKKMNQLSLLCMMLTVVVSVTCFTVIRANALYILTGTNSSAIVLDDTADVHDFSSKLVYVGTKADGFEVMLTAGQTVTIHYEGATLTATTNEETISTLLNRLHITPSPLDMIAVDLSGAGAELTIASDLTYYDTLTEPSHYGTIRVPTADLPKGQERVATEGQDGVQKAIYEVVYSAGEPVSRQLVEVKDSTAVDEVIEYGTSVGSVSKNDSLVDVTTNEDGTGVLAFSSGATLHFSDAKQMVATAYTAGYGGANHTTATGTTVRIGTVAVDKRVIPLGSHLFIVTNDGIVYGSSVAEDTGVRGNIIDLYHNTYNDCIQFGRRNCTVYVLD